MQWVPASGLDRSRPKAGLIAIAPWGRSPTNESKRSLFRMPSFRAIWPSLAALAQTSGASSPGLRGVAPDLAEGKTWNDATSLHRVYRGLAPGPFGPYLEAVFAEARLPLRDHPKTRPAPRLEVTEAKLSAESVWSLW